jgi:translin
MLKSKDKSREEVLSLSRSVVRLSSRAILATHRGDLEKARKRLRRARDKLNAMEELLEKCQEIKYGGFVYTAYQEYSEANLFLNFVEKRRFPTPEELGVPFIPFLLGMADFAGELRRKSLDSLREGDMKMAERCLSVMEDVYESYLLIDEGHALIPGFRSKLDLIRRRIEETRGDLARASVMRKW